MSKQTTSPLSGVEPIQHNVILGRPEDLHEALVDMDANSSGLIKFPSLNFTHVSYVPSLLIMAEKGFIYAPILKYPPERDRGLLEVYIARSAGSEVLSSFVGPYRQKPGGPEQFLDEPESTPCAKEASSIIFAIAGKIISKDFHQYLPDYNNFLKYIHDRTTSPTV
jgi:hypothetical protein